MVTNAAKFAAKCAAKFTAKCAAKCAAIFAAIFAAKLAAKSAANRTQRWSCPSDTPIVPTCDNFPDKPVIIFKTGSEAMSAQRRQRLNAAEKHIFRRHVLPPAGPLPSDPSPLEHALPKKEKKSSVVEL